MAVYDVLFQEPFIGRALYAEIQAAHHSKKLKSNEAPEAGASAALRM